MTLFDNAAGGGEPAEATGRAIMLELDTEAWTATLVREDLPSFHEPVASQGSYQALDDGAYFVGWGAQPFYSEYAAECVSLAAILGGFRSRLNFPRAPRSGTLVQDVTFGTTESIVMSYRAFKQSWAGYPLSSPSLAVNGSSAFASWNGATAVSSWVLVGGTSEDAATTRLAEEARNGFETEIGGLDDKYTFLAVAAMGSDVRACLPSPPALPPRTSLTRFGLGAGYLPRRLARLLDVVHGVHIDERHLPLGLDGRCGGHERNGVGERVGQLERRSGRAGDQACWGCSGSLCCGDHGVASCGVGEEASMYQRSTQTCQSPTSGTLSSLNRFSVFTSSSLSSRFA